MFKAQPTYWLIKGLDVNNDCSRVITTTADDIVRINWTYRHNSLTHKVAKLVYQFNNLIVKCNINKYGKRFLH